MRMEVWISNNNTRSYREAGDRILCFFEVVKSCSLPCFTMQIYKLFLYSTK